MAVTVGELRRAGHALFALFAEEEPGAGPRYLALPTGALRLAVHFVPSVYGDHALHGCAATLSALAAPAWLSGYGPKPCMLPS